ncbi:MAG TPA: thiamine phosphate synthase [Nevskiaceae bacterium]|nr:thiamine phosphate synthase [Nevskiaceae bacterium]
MMQLRGLYAITSDAICRSRELLVGSVAEAIAGGATLIQYRDKVSAPADRLANAKALAQLCRTRAVPLIVNDDPSIAVESGADGVHLGRADASLAQARQICGDRKIIGVTCANSLERALAAAQASASYVAIGRFYPSRTKPDAPQATLDLLRSVRAGVAGPICAIGGITPDRVPELIDAGADCVAAIEGVFGTPDVRSAAAAYAAHFS